MLDPTLSSFPSRPSCSPPSYTPSPPPSPPYDPHGYSYSSDFDRLNQNLERALLQLQQEVGEIFSKETDSLQNYTYRASRNREIPDPCRSWSFLQPLFYKFSLSELKTLALVNHNWNRCARQIAGVKLHEEGGLFLEEIEDCLALYGDEDIVSKREKIEKFRKKYVQGVTWNEAYPLASQANLIDFIGTAFSRVFDRGEVIRLQPLVSERPFNTRVFQLFAWCEDILLIENECSPRKKAHFLPRYVAQLLGKKYFKIAMTTAKLIPEEAFAKAMKQFAESIEEKEIDYNPKEHLLGLVRRLAAAEEVDLSISPVRKSGSVDRVKPTGATS